MPISSCRTIFVSITPQIYCKRCWFGGANVTRTVWLYHFHFSVCYFVWYRAMGKLPTPSGKRRFPTILSTTIPTTWSRICTASQTSSPAHLASRWMPCTTRTWTFPGALAGLVATYLTAVIFCLEKMFFHCIGSAGRAPNQRAQERCSRCRWQHQPRSARDYCVLDGTHPRHCEQLLHGHWW